MKPNILLYDPHEKENIEQILALFDPIEITPVAYRHDVSLEFEPEATVVCYLDDVDTRQFLRSAAGTDWTLAFLPHPKNPQTRRAFGISTKLSEAVEVSRDQDRAVAIDLMTCNDQAVINTVVVGELFNLTKGSTLTKKMHVRLLRFFNLLRGIRSVMLRPYKLTTQNGSTVDTAALGIMVVEDGRRTQILHRMVGNASVTDGSLHALILAPRSIGEMFHFLLSISVMRQQGDQNLPPYAGLMRSQALEIRSTDPIDFYLDDLHMSAQEIQMSVSLKCLKVIPGKQFSLEETTVNAKESVRVTALPLGEAKAALMNKRLPLVHLAATEEFKELYAALRENAKARPVFLTLMVLSTLLATLGLFANSSPVIIGAMILAPLMAPIISASMAVLRQDSGLGLQSAKTLFWGILLALGCAIVVTLLTPIQAINTEIAARLSPTLLDLGVAVISGIAGAYAHAREEIAKSLAGVAIAVALVPPLAVAGIGIGWLSWTVFQGAFLLFLTNLAGMILAASVSFWLLGFASFKRAKNGVLISLLIVGMISIPLAFSFNRMAEEHRIIRELDNQELAGVMIRDVRVLPGSPLRLSLTLISQTSPTDEVLDQLKSHIAAQLGRPVVLEIAVAIVR